LAVHVGDDDQDVTLLIAEGARIRGKVLVDGVPPDGKLDGVPVLVYRSDLIGQESMPLGRVEHDGALATPGLPATDYVVSVLALASAPFGGPGLSTRAVTLGGRDMIDAPIRLASGDVDGLTIDLTTRHSSISGQVSANADDLDRFGASVHVFPTDRHRWVGCGPAPLRFATASVDANGRYRLSGLPPGSYSVAATLGPTDDWQSPASLNRLAATAERVVIGEGSAATVSVRARR
jgi:hypothetical protein